MMMTSMFQFLYVSSLLVELRCSGAESNVARGKPANQSKTYNTNYASKAVDGNANTNAQTGSCAHGAEDPGGPNWWIVDLGQAVQIKNVIATNRDTMADRLDYFFVGVTNFSSWDWAPVRGGYPLCGQYPRKATAAKRLEVQCDPNIEPGRYVIVQQPSTGPGWMTICEFEVYLGNRTRKENVFKRLNNFRLMTSNVKLTLRQNSSLECSVYCRRTRGCLSVNVLESERSCELNFLPHGATPFDLHTNVIGWSWWYRVYYFEN